MKADDTPVGVRFNSSITLGLVAIGSENNSPRVVVEWLIPATQSNYVFVFAVFHFFCQLFD